MLYFILIWATIYLFLYSRRQRRELKRKRKQVAYLRSDRKLSRLTEGMLRYRLHLERRAEVEREEEWPTYL